MEACGAFRDDALAAKALRRGLVDMNGMLAPAMSFPDARSDHRGAQAARA
jgi:hypothetical protein